MKEKDVRGGVLRTSRLSFMFTFSNFLVGRSKLVNKNLHLRSIRRYDGDIPMLDTYYDFFFTGDDLPIIQKECWPKFVMLEKVEGKSSRYRLVPDIYSHKND